MRVITVLLLLPLARVPADEHPDARALAAHGLSEDADALRGFLRRLRPDGERKAQIAALIESLASRDPAVRAEAGRRLAALGAAPLAALEVAEQSGDPETRRRAAVLAARARRFLADELLYAVFHTIERRRHAGCAAEILAALPLCETGLVRDAAREALAVTATRADAALLRRTIQGGDEGVDAAVAAAAVRALARTFGADASAELAELLVHDAEEVRTAAALALANLGDRACLAALVGLLSARDPEARRASADALRTIAGESFGFSAYAAEEVRREPAEAWRRWFAEHGDRATWEAPLAGPPLRGRILVAVHKTNELVEFDFAGNEVWRRALPSSPWACAGTPDGHRLVTYHEGKSVVEYDAGGAEVWRRDDLPGLPLSVQRLSDGHVLVSCGSPGTALVEVTRTGAIAWSVTLPQIPTHAQRLPNGRTLVTYYSTGVVVEIDRAGKELWRVTGFDHPAASARLANGNTVVTESEGARIIEVTPGGARVWECAGLAGSCGAYLLPSGRFLFGNHTGLGEVGRAGDVTWVREFGGRIRISRY